MALLRKINVYRCPECQKPYKTLGAWASHMNAVHPEARPKGYSDLRFFYYVLTGKTHGTCVVCKKDTEWNEETGKYNRFCNNPKCKEIYKEEFRKRMMDKYGKITRMDEPEFFKKALAAKKISGTYKFKDGGELTYTGTYEKDFLQMMDTLLNYKSSDIMAPSPHTYYYMYEGKRHYYIPDFYIPNLNLEIEIKQNESTHPKILAVDKVKEKLKDEVMIANKKVNYLKLVDKNYEPIIHYLLNLKEQIPDRDMKASDLKKAERVLESTIGSYIQRKEDISSVLESIVYPEDIPLDTSDYNNRALMESYCQINENEYDSMMKDLHITSNDDGTPVVESIMDDPEMLKIVAIAGIMASTFAVTKGQKWWNEKVRPSKIYNKWKSLFVHLSRKNDTYTIKGVDYKLLTDRINETYDSDKLKKLIGPNYTKFSEFLFKRKKIQRRDMEIKSISFPAFFCVELQELFAELGEFYDDYIYRRIARLIYEKSWLSKADEQKIPLLDTSILKSELNEKYELLPHQKKFIELWDVLKGKLNLRGYILAFGQGLGKTLTATSLALCKNKKKVYIVCPNTLTVNWAEELKLYLKKYKDVNLWRDEVGIVGNSKYPVTKNCKYLICNNEGLDKLLPMIDLTGQDTMLVVDESQNFRNYNGTRVNQLLSVAGKIKAGDVLLCSGTPIKALPNEIVPSLMLIDPLMTDDVAHTYHLAFNIDNTLAAQIVNRRFGMIMYRKTKEELELPPREIKTVNVAISNSDPYLLSVVELQVQEKFKIYYEEKLAKNDELKQKYQSMVDRYHRAPFRVYNTYKKKFINSANTDKREYLHELDRVTIEGFVSKYVMPYIPQEHKKEFEKLYNDFVMMKQSAMGKANGEILPPLRAEVFTKLWNENTEFFLDAIDSRTKKTVIFSMFLPVVNAITDSINQSGRFKAVKITGSVKDRKAVIDRFKQDPDVRVLVATSQTLGTGVTLTEANFMLFFGPPWRSTDFEQCADRIHRIGQTSPVEIWDVMLADSRPNLTSRMNDIMQWSGDMFNSMIKTTDESELYDSAQESVFFDTETIEYRVDEFKQKKIHICFVTGISGSGKSTMAQNLANETSSELINMDNLMSPGRCNDDELMKQSKWIFKYFTLDGKEYREYDHFDPKKSSISTYYKIMHGMIRFIEKNMSKDDFFVIEGVQLFELTKKNVEKIYGIFIKKLLEYSVIIPGTALSKATNRALKRDLLLMKDRNEKLSERIAYTILRTLVIPPIELGNDRQVNNLRKTIKTHIAQENALGTLTDSRPYDNPVPTPDPGPEYDPINVAPSINIKTPGAFLKSDNVVKAMVPCVLDEISGEPSDGLSKMKLPVKELVNASSADPDSEEDITDRDRAIKKTNAILEKFDSYALLSRNKKLQEIKDLILRWNIDIDLSKYPKVKREMLRMNKSANESIYTNGYVFDYVGDYFKDLPIPTFESTIKNPDDLQPVYILLIHSGTLLANIIQKYTKDKYSHASISFDPSFKEFYSFGRKKNASGGFTIESRDDDFYKKRPECPYGIYVTFITSEQKEAMKNKLQYFIDNEDKFKYHFMGLAKIAFNKISENDTKYFCSGFVADILQAGGIATNRNYTLYKPQDLFHIYGSYKVDEGRGLQNIDPDVVIKNTQIAKEKYVKRFTK